MDEGFFKMGRDQTVGRIPIDEYGQGEFNIPVGEIVVDLERRKRLKGLPRFVAYHEVGLGEHGDSEGQALFIQAQVRGPDPCRPDRKPRRRIARQLLNRYAIDTMHACPDPLHFLSQELTVRQFGIDPFHHACQVTVQDWLGKSSYI